MPDAMPVVRVKGRPAAGFPDVADACRGSAGPDRPKAAVLFRQPPGGRAGAYEECLSAKVRGKAGTDDARVGHGTLMACRPSDGKAAIDQESRDWP